MIADVMISARVMNTIGSRCAVKVNTSAITPFPAARPPTTSQPALDTMLTSTCLRLAPSAMRRPISRVRRATLTETSD